DSGKEGSPGSAPGPRQSETACRREREQPVRDHPAVEVGRRSGQQGAEEQGDRGGLKGCLDHASTLPEKSSNVLRRMQNLCNKKADPDGPAFPTQASRRASPRLHAQPAPPVGTNRRRAGLRLSIAQVASLSFWASFSDWSFFSDWFSIWRMRSR